MITFMTRRILLILVLLVSALPLSAQIELRPANNGIDRILVRAMALDGEGRLLAGAPDGLFRRTLPDGEWTKLSLNNEVYSIRRLESGTILTGTSRGIYRSGDDGESWAQVYNVSGVGDFGVSEDGKIIAVDRGGNNTRDSFFYTSEDDGRNWSTSRLGFSVVFDTKVTALGSLFFSGSTNGLKLSYNGGGIWETTRLSDTVHGVRATANGTLVAYAGNLNVSSRIYESHDSGSSWRLVDSIPGIYAVEPAVEPGRGDDYFVVISGTFPDGDPESFGVWRRTAKSDKRTRIYEGNGAITVFPTEAQLLVGANYNVLIGDGASSEWTDLSRGATSVQIDQIVTSSNGLVYALVPDSIRFLNRQFDPTYALFRSENDADEWTQVADRLANTTLQVDRFGNVYADTDSLVVVASADGSLALLARLYGTRVSTDRGETWHDFGDGIVREVDAAGPGTIALLLNDSVNQPTRRDLTFSTDSGRSWRQLSDPGMPWEDSTARTFIRSSEVAADGSILLSLRGDDTSGIYRITSSAESTSIALVDAGDAPPDIELLESGRLITGSDVSGKGLKTSLDNGLTWSIYAPGTNINDITPLGGGLLWGNQRFYSNDEGANWVTGPGHSYVVLAPNGILYGTTGFTYRRSLSGGKLWLDDPFLDPPFATVLVASETGYIFVGSTGIYRTAGPVSSLRVEGDLYLRLELDLSLLSW